MFAVLVIGAAGRRVTEDELENMLESDDTNIFTQDVRHGNILLLLALCLKYRMREA